jgi:hypothetical protein
MGNLLADIQMCGAKTEAVLVGADMTATHNGGSGDTPASS